ncbi:MAG: hypothetical protein RIR26_549, partial [Pseudomonadota bacterium]
ARNAVIAPPLFGDTPMKHPRQGFLFLASLALSSVGCSTQVQTAAPQEWGSSVSAGQQEAEKLRNLSLPEEYKLGTDFDTAIKDPARAKETGVTIKTIENHPAAGYIRRIGNQLISTSLRNDVTYTFQLVQDDSINAFASMGGYVYVHTGLLKAAENEAQVASVMAHEMAHIGRKHSLQAMANQAALGGWIKGVGGLGGMMIGLTSAVLFQLPRSRSFEFEADSFGLENLRAAGYASEQMIYFFRNALAKNDPQDNKRHDWLSTHPDTYRRIEALKQKMTLADAEGLGLRSVDHQRVIEGL